MTTKKSFAYKGVFPAKWAFTLLLPLRNIFLSPKQLIRRLDLKENECVMELGPGPGYFSVPVAKALTSGKLYLVDIQSAMIAYARKRMRKRKIKNVVYYVCNGESFPYDDSYFDKIFMVTVLGEVENKDGYIAEFYRMLKPGGILSISEQAGDPDKITAKELISMMENQGFTFSKKYGSKRNFTVNFVKE